MRGCAQRRSRLAGHPRFPSPPTAGVGGRHWNSLALDGCHSGSSCKGRSHQDMAIFFQLRVKNNSLLKSFSKFPSF